MSEKFDPMRYYLGTGTVQAKVWRMGDSKHDLFLCWFGSPEYDRNKPIIKDRMRELAQPIVDKLNNGEMSEDDAKIALEKIW